MMNLRTVEEFAAACAGLTHEEIYEMYEIDIIPILRDEILEFCFDDDHPEPVRTALNSIGFLYKIKSLQDY